MEKEKDKARFRNGLIIPSMGRRGGLALLWKKDILVEIQGYSNHYIEAIVIDPSIGFKWRIIGFYGHFETHRRKESWDMLRELNRRYSFPWLCFRDFNEILTMGEKMGGARRHQKQMKDFCDAINKCGFKDLGVDIPFCNLHLTSHRG